MEFGFQRLVAYQESLAFMDRMYGLVERFPNVETYAMSRQARRASLSIPSNIAEGAGYSTKRMRFKSYAISRGSLFECVALTDAAARRLYVPKPEIIVVQQHASTVGRLLSGLMRSLDHLL